MNKRTFTVFCCLVIPIVQVLACTSALVGVKANPYGRPMLWKNRDTSNIDNKVEYVKGLKGEHSYVGLFNASDKNLQEVWMGMNDAGFAIMNTASYNLKDDKVPVSKMDKEGFLMAKALKKCSTVDDFENLLKTLPRPMGVEANFGVIDAYGNGAYFETNNHSYVRVNLDESPDNVIVRTNYSHSGRPDEGFGFVREASACTLLRPYIESKNVTADLFTEKLSRSFWHDMRGIDESVGSSRWVVDQDFIPRYKSTATVVIEGCKPLAPGEKTNEDFISAQYVMWTGLGYPPCSEIVPVYCREDGVRADLRGLKKNGHSEMGDKVKQRRDSVFPIKKGNGEKYVDMHMLFNDKGTGYVQTLVPKNMEVYDKCRKRRDCES